MSLLSTKMQDFVLQIEFHDSASRNSFSSRAAQELREICSTKQGQFKSIIFTAPGRVFCSGGNLSDYAALTTADLGKTVNREIAGVLDMFAHLSVPTVCVVQGDCFGGGLELASAFDLVLASPKALFGFWQRKVGLSFGWGGGARIEKRLGAQKLRQLALQAATLTAAEAYQYGLIDGVYLEARLMGQALWQAHRLQSLPKNPVAVMKAWTPENERESFESLWWSDEHRAILAQRKTN